MKPIQSKYSDNLLSGRSYLEPLDENVPNLPDVASALNRVVRVNDGNDSNVGQEE